MTGAKPKLLFLNGRFVPYDEARVHVLSTAFKYAASVFEGVRGYWSAERGQIYVFRLGEHIDRLYDSARVARIPVRHEKREIAEWVLDVVRRNGLRQDIHIRILLFVEDDDGRLDSVEPVGLAIAPVPMARYEDAAGGLHVSVSSWRRVSDTTMAPRVKTIGTYHNSRLALLQARSDGYDDAVLLNEHGKVAEGPGYNIFVVRAGAVLTPPGTAGILEGITRRTLVQLFADIHRVRVQERDIDRTELYLAEEAFFCGSGKEIVPIASVDRHALSGGVPGPWTRRIRATYFEVVRGERPEYGDWLSPVYG